MKECMKNGILLTVFCLIDDMISTPESDQNDEIDNQKDNGEHECNAVEKKEK